MPANPLLTVVLIIGEKRDRAQRALASVLSQDIAEQFVIVVYDRAREAARDFAELTAPNVMYEAVGPKTTLGQLQKRAVLAAKTDVIAFIEEHIVVPPGWARESLRLHAKGYAGIAGTFCSGNPEHRWSRIAFNITYGDYVLPRQSGETRMIPGDNSTFIRAKLLPYTEDLELLLNNDILLIRRLLAQGEKLYRADLTLTHWNETAWWGAWMALLYWNQMYISNLIATERWPAARRLLRLISVPLVPFVRSYGNYKRAKRNAVNMKDFFAEMPGTFLLNSGSAAGIAAGLLFGRQNSEYKFADCETNADRQD